MISPASILKNIFHLPNINNPTAEVFYSLLALWRNCPREAEPDVLSYLWKAGKQCMKFKGAEFVEFLRRVLDFPRRDVLNATNPDFSKQVNKTIATACGAKVHLAPETIYQFTTPLTRSKSGSLSRKSLNFFLNVK